VHNAQKKDCKSTDCEWSGVCQGPAISWREPPARSSRAGGWQAGQARAAAIWRLSMWGCGMLATRDNPAFYRIAQA